MTNCPDCAHANLAGEENCSHCHAPIASMALPQPKQGMQRRIMEGTVGDLQVQTAVTVAEEATLETAVKTMRQRKVGCMVVTRGTALRGMLTERDVLLKTDQAKDPAKTLVSDVMRQDTSLLREDEPVAYAFHKMAIHGLRHLPVRRADGTLGVVSSRDLLRYLCTEEKTG